MSGLKDSVHELLVINYLKFYRDKQTSHIADVNGSCDDCRDMRLIQTVYTKEELADEYATLRDLVSDTFSDQLEKYTEQNLHFVKQLMLQAEGQDADISVDTADVEDAKLIDDLARLDLDGERKHSGPSTKTGDAKLHMKINELKDESDRVGGRLDKLDSQLKSTEEDNDDLEGDVKAMRRELQELQDDTMALPGSKLSSQVMELREELLKLKESNNAALSPLRADVSYYREELATKVAECSQYKQLLKMTQQKNKQLRDLRDEA